MSDTQNPATENNSADCNCCSYTDGRNVVNICASGNTLYIGCMPPAAECQQEAAEDETSAETPAENTSV